MILSLQQDIEFLEKVNHRYENYLEKTITHRRFKHSDIKPLITGLDKKGFDVKKAGESVQHREIYLAKWGNGLGKLFLWSQMHGDEPTATMALLDVFNFLSIDDEFNDFRSFIKNKLTLFFMPMVNPDGTELYQRRNIFEIDVNRDAVKQQTPEGKLLMDTFNSLKADFGFNLHDQSTRYSVGNSPKPATLSFLAPTVDYEKSISPRRGDAMKLVSKIFKNISHFIPGNIAKYSDEFEPRAFGDNFQKSGTRTILVESGGYKNDPEKQFIRRMNFLTLLSAFKSIAEESYKSEDLQVYNEIPLNEEFIMDLLLRNLTVKEVNKQYLIDIGINKEEENWNDAKEFYLKSSIEDLGDLSVFHGYEEYDLKGMEVSKGKTFPKIFNSVSEIEKINFTSLYYKGYTNVILKDNGVKPGPTKMPVNIYIQNEPDESEKVILNQTANLIIKEEGKVKYVIINGFIINPEKINFKNCNGLILKP
jgi:hypothetical protein